MPFLFLEGISRKPSNYMRQQRNPLAEPENQKKLVISYVKYYLKHNRRDFKTNQQAIKYIRETNATKFGEMKGTDLRQTLELPSMLFSAIQVAMPAWFNDARNLDWFVKKFPMFSTEDDMRAGLTGRR